MLPALPTLRGSLAEGRKEGSPSGDHMTLGWVRRLSRARPQSGYQLYLFAQPLDSAGRVAVGCTGHTDSYRGIDI